MFAQLTLHRIDNYNVHYFTMDAITENLLIQASKGTYSWHHEYRGRRFLKSKNVSGTVSKAPTNVHVEFKKWSYEGKTGMYAIVDYPEIEITRTSTPDIMA